MEPNLERHYNDLLKAISEIGRDVKPAYTNNKVSTDRLRKSKFTFINFSLAVSCTINWRIVCIFQNGTEQIGIVWESEL